MRQIGDEAGRIQHFFIEARREKGAYGHDHNC
jgi:hypothetical protein